MFWPSGYHTTTLSTSKPVHNVTYQLSTKHKTSHTCPFFYCSKHTASGQVVLLAIEIGPQGISRKRHMTRAVCGFNIENVNPQKHKSSAYLIITPHEVFFASSLPRPQTERSLALKHQATSCHPPQYYENSYSLSFSLFADLNLLAVGGTTM